MAIGPFLRRELISASRRADFYQNRVAAAVAVTGLLVAAVVAWDQSGRDRTTVRGASRFALATFGAIIALQTVLAVGAVPVVVAPAIASERDRKTLDALLTTRLSSAMIVTGALAASLVRFATSQAALIPFLALVICFGGIDPLQAILAAAGVASTVFAVGSLSIAISAGARTARRSIGVAGALVTSWVALPMALGPLIPRLWPSGAPWTMPIIFGWLHTTPLIVPLNVFGIVRLAPLFQTALVMIGLQTAGGVVLALWAIVRLRPASRAAFDEAGRASLLRSLRLRRRTRPSCGDDPVYWNEVHSSNGVGEAERLTSWLLLAIWSGFLVFAISWFVPPAFAELRGHGYGALPGAPARLELNPFLRAMLVNFRRFSAAPPPGQARLELNVALRMVTAILELMILLMVAGGVAESLASEKERETWTVLLATPLTGREILRGKMLGVIRKARGLVFLIVGSWTAGLLAGAVHPLGFLAALAGLTVSIGFAASVAARAALRAPDRVKAHALALAPLMATILTGAAPIALPARSASVLFGVASSPFLGVLSLVSYEDVSAASRSEPFGSLDVLGLDTGEGALIVGLTCAIGMTAQGVSAFFLARSAYRGFDSAVGRAGNRDPSITPRPGEVERS